MEETHRLQGNPRLSHWKETSQTAQQGSHQRRRYSLRYRCHVARSQNRSGSMTQDGSGHQKLMHETQETNGLDEYL